MIIRGCNGKLRFDLSRITVTPTKVIFTITSGGNKITKTITDIPSDGIYDVKLSQNDTLLLTQREAIVEAQINYGDNQVAKTIKHRISVLDSNDTELSGTGAELGEEIVEYIIMSQSSKIKDGVGISEITFKETDTDGNNVYTIHLTNGTSYDIVCPKGGKGDKGDNGTDGTNGINGTNGTNGTNGQNGADGITPHIDNTTYHWMIGDYDTGISAKGIKGDNGNNGVDGTNGINGQNGYSPTINISKQGNINIVTVTDVDGTRSYDIYDGEKGDKGNKGENGLPGISPTVTVTRLDGKVQISVTDAYGTSEAYIYDGQGLEPGNYRTSAEQDIIDNNKVDKIVGKGLSTEDFTTELKDKLEDGTLVLNLYYNDNDEKYIADKDGNRLTYIDIFWYYVIDHRLIRLHDLYNNIVYTLAGLESDRLLFTGVMRDDIVFIMMRFNGTIITGNAGLTNKIDANVITNQSITLAQVKTIIDEINTNHEHAFFDVSALGANMYLCTIYMDTEKYKIFDLVSGRYTEGVYEASKLLTMCLVNAEGIATQSQIDHLQNEIDEFCGSEKIKDWSQLGDLILNGESTNYISAGDKIDVNWIKSVLGTTTHGNSVVCSDIWRFAFGVGEAEAKDYYFVYDGTNWTYNEAVIDLSDFALTVGGAIETGEVMTITTAVTPVNFTFTAYDKFESSETSVPHNWVLEATYAPDVKAYDTYEALFVLDEGYTLPAGKYKLHQRYYDTQPFIDVYLTTSQAFTAADGILQFASTGYQYVACIPGSETKYYIASNVRPVYKNRNTYLTSNIAIEYNKTGDDWVDISSIEGVRITSAHIQTALGNNCPAYCNLRQYLNDESANGTYSATHDFDRPSAYNFQKGYLYGIDPRVYALILPTKTKFTAGYNNGEYTRGQTYDNVDKVFLLSMKEMSFNIQTSEGNVTDLYGEYTENVLTDDAVAARAKYNKAGGTLNSYRWSRSCQSSHASHSRLVTSSGGSGYSDAFSAIFFAAAFMIGKKSENQ